MSKEEQAIAHAIGNRWRCRSATMYDCPIHRKLASHADCQRLGASCFAFPDDQHSPSESSQCGGATAIAPPVALKFLLPELSA